MKEYRCKNLYDASPSISDADIRRLLDADCVVAPAGYSSSLADAFPVVAKELFAAAALGKRILHASLFNCSEHEHERGLIRQALSPSPHGLR